MNNETYMLQDLYRLEFTKIIAVISKKFGLQHIEIAEDIVGETFLQATETWQSKGVPANPTAWLYVVAKQKALYHLHRNKILDNKVIPQIKSRMETVDDSQINFSMDNIKDSQLQMMFAVCDPSIASESQIALALRVLCGFGIDEIAEAFLSNKETINKRLHRAKEKLKSEYIKLELPHDSEIHKRLDTVLHIIYLLFNEGYSSSTQNQVLRKDFCLEALRLATLLTDFSITNRPKTNAQIALMCYHISRFEARKNDNDEFILYDEQDDSLWSKELIDRGNYFFDLSAKGNEISSYHLEAGIAFWHCQKQDSVEKWENILHHYNLLLQVNYSPVAALNRAFVISKVKGKKEAISEAEKLNLAGNHFYFTLLGELYSGIDDTKAKLHFQKALSLAKTQTNKNIIQRKLNAFE